MKNYEGDVEDLGLVFEWTEDIMGQMKTYELREGKFLWAKNSVREFFRIKKFQIDVISKMNSPKL